MLLVLFGIFDVGKNTVLANSKSTRLPFLVRRNRTFWQFTSCHFFMVEHNGAPASLNALDGMFSFDGRLNRLPYFFIILIDWPIGYVLGLVCLEDFPKISPWVAIFFAIWVWLSLSNTVRRLHDIWIGWAKCLLLALLTVAIPFAQWILIFKKWQADENEWGKPLI